MATAINKGILSACLISSFEPYTLFTAQIDYNASLDASG